MNRRNIIKPIPCGEDSNDIETVMNDNNSYTEIVKFPKSHPRTKHASENCYHCNGEAVDGTINFLPIDNNDQKIGIFSKLFPREPLRKLWKLLMGW